MQVSIVAHADTFKLSLHCCAHFAQFLSPFRVSNHDAASLGCHKACVASVALLEPAVYSRGEQTMQLDQIARTLMLDDEAEAASLCKSFSLTLLKQGGQSFVVFNKVCVGMCAHAHTQLRPSFTLPFAQ